MANHIASSQFAVVAIGASAGGVQALTTVIEGLPRDLNAAVMVVLHLDRHHDSRLAYLLGRRAALPVKPAAHGDAIVPGRVYVAPPDVHLLAAGGRVELTHTKLVHFVRPSVDLLFESVAAGYEHRAIGVILTGTGTDGATGLRAIKRMGGVTIVEDPGTAAHAGMPRAACATGAVDHVVPLPAIAGLLATLAAAGPDERNRTIA